MEELVNMVHDHVHIESEHDLTCMSILDLDIDEIYTYFILPD